MAGKPLPSSQDFEPLCSNLLMEMEKHIHLAVILSVQSDLKGTLTFQGKRQGGAVLWERAKEGRKQVIASLAELAQSGPCTAILRCFTSVMDPATMSRVKNLYGWRLQKAGGSFGADALTKQELTNLCAKDPVTGKVQILGTDLAFKVGNSIH